MIYRVAAEAVLLLHFGFILFAVLGGLAVARWGWLALFHVPAVAWSFFVETTGRICPLTYAENLLRSRAGRSGYAEGFLEHYLLPVIYPGLTQEFTTWLAAGIVVVNLAIYFWLFRRRRSLHPAGLPTQARPARLASNSRE